MASGVVVTGFDELRKTTDRLTKEVLDQAILEAENAAAQVMQRAMQAAAPRGETGKLAESIIIYETKDRRALFQGGARRRLLVGPAKRRGFYGFFLEYGTRKMAARPWARPAVDSVESEAMEAGKQAFQRYVEGSLK